MPHVIAKLWPGKSEQQKRRLAKTITKETQQKVRKAAARLGYRANVHARMLGMRVRGSGGRSEGSRTSLEEQARRLEELEQETAKLRQMISELRLEKR